MKLSKNLEALLESAKEDLSYAVEEAKLDFSIALDKQRRASGLNYSAVADKLGNSLAYVSKVFRGDSNLTIESMVKLADATGGRLHIEVVDKALPVRRWDNGAKFVFLNVGHGHHVTTKESTVVSGLPNELLDELKAA